MPGFLLVPRERLELSRGVAPVDFESTASTDSATQAWARIIAGLCGVGAAFGVSFTNSVGVAAALPRTIAHPMRRSDFNYSLPPQLIAQRPPELRGESRLLCLETGAALADRMIRDL